MGPGQTYGTVVYSDFLGGDGFLYRAAFELAGYGGAATEIEDRMRGLVIEWGADLADPAEILASLGVSVATVTLVDPTGYLSAAAGAAPGAWRLRLLRDTDENGTPEDLVWQGYHLPGRTEDLFAASLPGVTLLFSDGFGLLESNPFAGDASWGGFYDYTYESVLGSFGRVLSGLGGEHASGASWKGLTTAMGWRPWLPVGAAQLPSTADPLWHIRHYGTGWVDDDGNTWNSLEALRALAGRFLLRLFQSEGRWYLLQREIIARYAGSAPLAAYGLTATGSEDVIDTSAAAEPITSALTQDVDPDVWTVGVPGRVIEQPVREVVSAYAFAPLRDVLTNGSFEVAAATSAEAEGWTLSGWNGGGQRVLASSTFMDPGLDDIYVMQVYGYGPTDTITKAVQEDRFFVPESSGWAFDASWNVGWKFPTSINDFGGVLFKVGSYYLHKGTVTVVQEQYGGEDAVLYADALASGVAGATFGTPIIPEGAVLEFYDSGGTYVGAFTLSEAAKVGDRTLRGDLSADVEPGATADFYYWKASAGSYLDGTGTVTVAGILAGIERVSTRRVFATGYGVDGARVSGYVTAELYGPEIDTDGQGAAVYSLFDNVKVTIKAVAGGTFSAPTARSATCALSTTTPGLSATVPTRSTVGAHPVGDGPLYDSETRLFARGADGNDYNVELGADTGWKSGTWGSGESSNGRGLETHTARQAAEQLSAGSGGAIGVQRWRGRIHLDGQRTLPPHKVPKVRQWTRLVSQAAVGATSAVLYAPPQVGQSLVLSPGTASEETRTITAVTAGGSTYTAEWTGALTNTHAAGGMVVYVLMVWWDHMVWDVTGGFVDYDGSAIGRNTAATYTEAVALTTGASAGAAGTVGGVGILPGEGGGSGVPSGRTLTFSASDGFTFTPSTAVDLSQDRAWALTPPQGLDTDDAPTFDQLTLTSAGTGTDNAVRADRTLSAGTGLTGGGTLQANRSFALTGQALALHNLASNGLIARTAAATVAARQMATGSPNSVTWTNANAVGGNPSISLAQDIHTAATPRFARLGLGAAAHGTHALYVNGTSSFEDDLTSPTFVSGFGGEGFRIQRDTAGGKGANYWEGTFDELWVRGRMHVYELIVQQIRATNGSVLVANAAKVKTVAPGVGVGSYDLTFDLDYTVFAVNDILLAQRFEQTSGGQTTVYQSFVRVTAIAGTTVTVAVLSSSDPPEAGFDYVRIGNTTDADRQGSVYLTADDQDAPYIDVRDGVDSVAAWGGGASKVRLGKLDGITDAEFGVLSGYGLWAGNAYVTGRAVVREGQIGSATVHWLLGSEGSGAAEAAYLRSVAHASNTLSIEAGVDFARVVANATNVETQEVALFVEDGGGWGLRGVVDGFEFFRLGSANHIAGWSFNETQFSGGNIRLVKTGRIWNTGGGWDLQNDGSGQVASGNIAWDASGNVTFDPSVTLSWAQITSVPTLNLLGAVADTSDVWGGAFPPSGWASYGGDSFGSILVDEGPFGDDEPLWRARRTSGTGDAGGTNLTAHAAVDTSKRHRISFFFRGPVSASLFFDAKYTTPNCINRSNATTGGFSQTRWMDVTSAEVDESRWMLFVGYVYPKGTFNSPTIHTVQSGIYDAVTGERLLAADFDLAWNASAGAEEALAYTAFQISFGTPAETLFARPRIDVVDESGYVTLTDLLSASATTITRHLVSAPLIQGATIEAGQKIYVGAGNYANADTAFYTDNTGGGRISIGNRLTFSVSGGTFALGGNLTVGAGGNVTVSSTGFISAGGGVVRLGSYGARITAGAADANKLSWRNALDTTDLGSLNVGTDSVATLYGDQGIRLSTAAGAKIRSLTTSSLWEIDKANFVVLVDGEPADSALQNGTLAVWGSSGDTGFLYVKFKTSGGIIVKRRVALSSY